MNVVGLFNRRLILIDKSLTTRVVQNYSRERGSYEAFWVCTGLSTGQNLGLWTLCDVSWHVPSAVVRE